MNHFSALSCLRAPAMDLTTCVGRCLLFFYLAILLDVVGLILFLVGVAAPLSFWDFFVFSGPLLIFLSLAFWIFWYVGNLEVPLEQVLPRWDSSSLPSLGKLSNFLSAGAGKWNPGYSKCRSSRLKHQIVITCCEMPLMKICYPL